MIKIAILDDEELYLKKEMKLTQSFFKKKGMECEVTTYGSVEWFEYDLREIAYDAYILDIEMPEKNGLDVARRIREDYPDAVIVFVTKYIKYAVEAYEVRAYRYILKEEMDEKLYPCFESLLLQLQRNESKYYIIEKRGKVEKIPCQDILYLKKDGKYVTLFHKRGESRVRKSLENVLAELESSDFVTVEKGYAANLLHVMKMKNNELVMRDGTALNVGKARVGKVRKAVLDYWK